jgi:hypothetical protein
MGRNTWIIAAIAIGGVGLLWYTGFFCKYSATMGLCKFSTGPGHARALEQQLTMGGRFRSPHPTGNAPIPEGHIP